MKALVFLTSLQSYLTQNYRCWQNYICIERNVHDQNIQYWASMHVLLDNIW